MTWHYLNSHCSPEPAEESSEVSSWGSAPLALWKRIPIAVLCYSRDKETECCRYSQSGTTSARSMESHGEAQSTLSQVDSHAKTLAQRVRVQDCPENVQGWFSRCCELLRRCNLILSSRKTVRFCVPVDLAPSSKNLTAWGMMQDGVCWELGISARPIEETGCGYLPTPSASSYGTNKGGAAGRTGKERPSLQTMAKTGVWPAPTCHDRKGKTGAIRGKNAKGGPTLTQAVGGTLNPNWVEWLMGWPIGWTDSKQLATDKFLEWQHSHGIY